MSKDCEIYVNLVFPVFEMQWEKYRNPIKKETYIMGSRHKAGNKEERHCERSEAILGKVRNPTPPVIPVFGAQRRNTGIPSWKNLHYEFRVPEPALGGLGIAYNATMPLARSKRESPKIPSIGILNQYFLASRRWKFLKIHKSVTKPRSKEPACGRQVGEQVLKVL